MISFNRLVFVVLVVACTTSARSQWVKVKDGSFWAVTVGKVAIQ